ncbi:hypothetical protein CLCR_07738 [Cladophialophora carrionii]|uniref:Uncharacterized protein n=1 Tax=Cladophialophora carrionii TaxID=86049 RepID=A0A1C1CQK8_9EURO|nr:hypothetical protein CLCR_07738 [Cladophialophora carrionii]
MASDAHAPAPAAAHAPAQGGMIDQKDVQDWVQRFNEGLADSSVITAPSAPDARPWHTSFFSCFAPIDTCRCSSSIGHISSDELIPQHRPDYLLRAMRDLRQDTPPKPKAWKHGWLQLHQRLGESAPEADSPVGFNLTGDG